MPTDAEEYPVGPRLIELIVHFTLLQFLTFFSSSYSSFSF